jgi:hypothetical protein
MQELDITGSHACYTALLAKSHAISLLIRDSACEILHSQLLCLTTFVCDGVTVMQHICCIHEVFATLFDQMSVAIDDCPANCQNQL